MATRKWRLVVTHLSGDTALNEVEVEANNWMGALRAGRQQLSEDGGVPPGASCAVAPDGAVTILDPASRRRFLLTPDPGGSSASTPAQATPGASEATAPATRGTPPPASAGAPAKKKRFQTVAYVPDAERAQIDAAVQAARAASPAPAPVPAQEAAAQAPAPAPTPVAPAASPAVPAAGHGKKAKFQTVAFSGDEWKAQHQSHAAKVESAASGAGVAAGEPGLDATPAASDVPASQASSLQAAAAAQAPADAPQPVSQAPRARLSSRPLETVPLTLLLRRDEAPSPNNPLTYAERAYLLPENATVTQAEAALRFKLADIQRELADHARGQFINLAVFDHRWEDRPLRPPLVVIEWKDWKGDPWVDYPAAEVSRSAPPEAGGGHDDRLADVFEALTELHHKPNASAALEFAVQLLGHFIPAESSGACLYDINTDEMRFVAAAGTGAEARRGTAVSSSAGLLGEAAHGGDRTLAIQNIAAEPRYDAEVDGRPGLSARNQLLRPLIHEGHLVGILQLTNKRDGGGFTDGDVNVINYMAERLADFVYGVRMRRQSQRPPGP